MSIKLMVYIIGGLGMAFFWFMLRSLIKEGVIESETRWMFLLRK